MNSDGTALGQAAFLPSRFARFLFCPYKETDSHASLRTGSE